MHIVSQNLVLCSVTVIDEVQSCSIGSLPKLIDVSAANSIEIVNSYPALLLSQAESTCNGTVNSWKVCFSISGPSESKARIRPNNISVGVWRLNGLGTHTLLGGKLVPVPVSETYFQFEFLCQRFSVASIEVMEGDLVGVVIHDAPTGLSVVGASSDGGNRMCVREKLSGSDFLLVNISYLNCTHTGYALLLQGTFV